jgi:NAD(P)-dependent dehydrogenase (short-subunit alcohol dehydrogenase family)
MGRFDGKVGFVTGGAREQGRANALRLADEGADIVVLDLCETVSGINFQMGTEELLEETAQMVRDRGRRVIARRADVRDQASLDAVVDEAVQTFGGIDVVSTTADVVSWGTVADIGRDEWAQVIDINLSGVWRTAKAVIPTMRRAGTGGSIVTTSSSAGLRGYADCAHRVAAAHAVIRLTHMLAFELARDDIRVNAICPGLLHDHVPTGPGVLRPFRHDLDDSATPNPLSAVATIELAPPSKSELADVANAFAWLVSDVARYVTGIVIPIDVGRSGG